MFTDILPLTLKAGKGGNGIIAWRREKYIPKGGPCGGDGGKGGSIIIKTSAHLLSLDSLRHKKHFLAKNGGDGGPNNRKGKNGKDQLIEVPIGTLIKEAESNTILYDLTKLQEQIILCRGGKGGKGNTHFKSSTNRAPHQFTFGVKGEEKEVILELKLIADIGLIGMPNAGKSTLLSNISKVDIKIGNYPFTTLHPNLAVMEFEDFSKTYIADIPGIIKNAHKDKGLGLSFLKHIERTKMLVYVLNAAKEEEQDPVQDFIMLKNELKQYNKAILDKPFLIALNKIDLSSSQETLKEFMEKFSYLKDYIIPISAKTSQGIDKFVSYMHQIVIHKN